MTPDDLDTLAALVRARAGLVLQGDAAYFAETRLGALARLQGAASVSLLMQRLRARPDEALVQAVVESMTVGETAFFRDREVWEQLGAALLPKLAANRADGVVRVWSAGCSTGQEAYSLAMLGQELHAENPGVRIEVVGTDLSQSALEKAQAGLYTQFEVQRGLPVRMLLAHFEKLGDAWRVSSELRDSVRWRRLNLIEDRRSVRPFDLILCRYVLSDFEPRVRDQVLARFAPALAPDGLLLLGRDESPSGSNYQSAAEGCGLFRRNPATGLAAA